MPYRRAASCRTLPAFRLANRAPAAPPACLPVRPRITVKMNDQPVSTDPALYVPHLDRALQLVRKYSFVYSDAPFRSRVPLIGPWIAGVKGLARRALRAAVGVAWGSQAEFNAAVAEILFEFTRRATLAQAPQPAETALMARLAAPPAGTDGREQALAAALQDLARQVDALRAGVQAANLSAAAAEQRLAELARELARLEASLRE